MPFKQTNWLQSIIIVTTTFFFVVFLGGWGGGPGTSPKLAQPQHFNHCLFHHQLLETSRASMWFRRPTDDLQSFNVRLHAVEPEVRGHVDPIYTAKHQTL